MFISPLFSDSQLPGGVFGVIFPLGNPALAGYEVNTSHSGAKKEHSQKVGSLAEVVERTQHEYFRCLVCWNIGMKTKDYYKGVMSL